VKKLIGVMGLLSVGAVMLIPSAGTAVTAQQPATVDVVAVTGDTAPPPPAKPAPAATPVAALPARAATLTPPPPAVTTSVVPVPVPADITGAAQPGRAQNAPLVPGHWTQDANTGAIYRDPSPDSAPTVGASDPAYEDRLNTQLCAAKPWTC
jgi:hypothetical protein